MNEIKLLPCPFCGGEAKTYTATTLENGLKRKYWLVHCEKCELNYSTSKNKCFTEAEAIKLWNTRKPMQEIVERLEKSKDGFYKGKSRDYQAYNQAMRRAIEIVKEVGGMNENI